MSAFPVREGLAGLRLALVWSAFVSYVAALSGGGAALVESAVWTVAGSWAATTAMAATGLAPAGGWRGTTSSIPRIGPRGGARELLGEVALWGLLSLVLVWGTAATRSGDVPGVPFAAGLAVAGGWAAVRYLPAWSGRADRGWNPSAPTDVAGRAAARYHVLRGAAGAAGAAPVASSGGTPAVERELGHRRRHAPERRRGTGAWPAARVRAPRGGGSRRERARDAVSLRLVRGSQPPPASSPIPATPASSAAPPSAG